MYLWCLRQAEDGPPVAPPQSRSLGRQKGLQPMPVAVEALEAPALKTAANRGQNLVWGQIIQASGPHLTRLCCFVRPPSALQEDKTCLPIGLSPLSSLRTGAPWGPALFPFARWHVPSANNSARNKADAWHISVGWTEEMLRFTDQNKTQSGSRACSSQHLRVAFHLGCTVASPGGLLKAFISNLTPD